MLCTLRYALFSYARLHLNKGRPEKD